MKLFRLFVTMLKWLHRHRRATLLVVIVAAALFSIDWGSAQVDLPPRTRAHMQECALAHRELGKERLLAQRPDCGRYLPSR